MGPQSLMSQHITPQIHPIYLQVLKTQPIGLNLMNLDFQIDNLDLGTGSLTTFDQNN